MQKKRLFFGSLWILLLLLLDQGTKAWAVRDLRGASPISLIPGVLELHYLENRGAAFGILQNRQIFFIFLAFMIFFAAFRLYQKSSPSRRSLPFRISMILLASGAAGTAVDRAVRGYVVDFIYFSLIDFPIFNTADICVSLGTALLLVLILFFMKEEDFPKLWGKDV